MYQLQTASRDFKEVIRVKAKAALMEQSFVDKSVEKITADLLRKVTSYYDARNHVV